MVGGLLKPKNKILGSDIAGRVEAVGRNAKQFQPGDEVFGDLSVCGWGGFAEYVYSREDALALKPASLTFEAVATVPMAAVTALQGLRDRQPNKNENYRITYPRHETPRQFLQHLPGQGIGRRRSPRKHRIRQPVGRHPGRHLPLLIDFYLLNGYISKYRQT